MAIAKGEQVRCSAIKHQKETLGGVVRANRPVLHSRDLFQSKIGNGEWIEDVTAAFRDQEASNVWVMETLDSNC